MSESDNFEYPDFGARPTFWSTVEWRVGLGLVFCLLTGITVFFLSLFNARHPLDVPLMTFGSTVGIAILWVVARVLWAWVEWPSVNRGVRGVKAVIRYFAFDAAAERRESRRTDGSEKGRSGPPTSAP